MVEYTNLSDVWHDARKAATRIYLWAFSFVFGTLAKPVRNAARFPRWAGWICDNILFFSELKHQKHNNIKL